MDKRSLWFALPDSKLLPVFASALLISACSGQEEHQKLWQQKYVKAQQEYAQGNYTAALTDYQLALGEARLLEQDKLPLALSLAELAVTLRKLGKMEEAGPLYEEALKAFESQSFSKSNNEDALSVHLHIARCSSDLGDILSAAGERKQSIRYYQKAVAAYSSYSNKAPGGRQETNAEIEIAAALEKLAKAYEATNQMDKAKGCYSIIVTQQNSRILPEKQFAEISMSYLKLLRSIGNDDLAREVETSLGIGTAQQPAASWLKHMEEGDYNVKLGKSHFQQSEKAYLKALDTAQGLGPKDPRIAKTLNSLGYLYTRMGKAHDAEQAFFESIQASTSDGAMQSESTGQSYEGLAYLYAAQHDTEKARYYSILWYKHLKANNPHGDPRENVALNLIGDILMQAKNYAKAEKFFRRVFDALNVDPSKEQGNWAHAGSMLVLTLLLDDKKPEAKKLLVQNIKRFNTDGLPRHDFVNLLDIAVDKYTEAAEPSDAKAIAELWYKALQKQAGAEDPMTRKAATLVSQWQK